MPRILKFFMLVTDLAFISYWTLAALMASGWAAIPSDWLYSNYADRTITQWNWSFLPLDITLSIIGLTSVYLARRGDERWRFLAIISLTLTIAAGLMAISFWAIRREFDIGWWIANLYLIVWPLAFLIPSKRSILANSMRA